MSEYRITDAQLAKIDTMVRTGNSAAFAALAKAVRRRRVIDTAPNSAPAPARAVYFSDFILAELAALLGRADMNSLLRSAAYMREGRRALFYWRLTPEYSHKYYNSTADARGTYNYEHAGERALFADVLNARLRCAREQLCLTLAKGPRDAGDRLVRKRRGNTIDLRYLQNLHALTLDDVEIAGSLSHLATLREFTVLLGNCAKTINMQNFSRDADFSGLGGCTSVHIQGNYWTRISAENLACLRSCRSLWLEGVGRLSVGALEQLPVLRRLFLHGCSYSDYLFSRLDRQIDLYLSGFPNVGHSMTRGFGAFRSLHFAVERITDMESLTRMAGADSLYLMPKRGARTLLKAFNRAFPSAKTWEDDGTWAANMYF